MECLLQKAATPSDDEEDDEQDNEMALAMGFSGFGSK